MKLDGVEFMIAHDRDRVAGINHLSNNPQDFPVLCAAINEVPKKCSPETIGVLEAKVTSLIAQAIQRSLVERAGDKNPKAGTARVRQKA